MVTLNEKTSGKFDNPKWEEKNKKNIGRPRNRWRPLSILDL